MSVSIVAPVIANMEASGNALVESIESTTVAMTGIEYVYAADIARGGDLLLAFTVTDHDVHDGSANIVVTLDSSFQDALAAAMAEAVGGLASGANLSTNSFPTASASDLLEATLDSEITGEMASWLDTNGVLEFLEANALSQLDVKVDWSGAAADMYSKLNNANLLKMFYLQVGNRAINDNTDASAGPVTFADVMNAGDKLAFVFDLATTLSITQVNVNVTTDISGDVSGNSTGIAPNLGPNVTNLSTASRRVAFVLSVIA